MLGDGFIPFYILPLSARFFENEVSHVQQRFSPREDRRP